MRAEMTSTLFLEELAKASQQKDAFAVFDCFCKTPPADDMEANIGMIRLLIYGIQHKGIYLQHYQWFELWEKEVTNDAKLLRQTEKRNK